MSKIHHRNPLTAKTLYQNDKQNISNSEIESLLVSSVRYDGPIIGDSQNSSLKSKGNQQSLIKKQYCSNVYVLDQSTNNECQKCSKYEKKLSILDETIKVINLKLQEFQSKISLCFNKYGQMQSKLSELQMISEQVRHIGWQSKQALKQINCTEGKNDSQLKYKLKDIDGELSKLKKIINKLESNEKVCFESKMVDHKLQKFRDEQEYKLSSIVQTLEDIGQLQRKLIHHQQINQQKKIDDSLFKPSKKYFRTFSISDKSRTNESTNISYSRNNQTSK